MTKLHELLGHIFTTKPDVIIINENGLKIYFQMLRFWRSSLKLDIWNSSLIVIGSKVGIVKSAPIAENIIVF